MEDNKKFMHHPVIYCDMDGVLAKWNPDASQEEVAERDYFLNREIEFPMVAAVHLLLQKGYDVRVLSAAYTVRACWEKRQWLNGAGLIGIDATFVPYGEPKSDYVDEDNAILIDDFGKNLKEWTGVPVKFYNGINGHGGSTYKYSLFHNWDAQTLAKKVEDILLENS